MHRRDAQISSADLPHLASLQPHIRNHLLVNIVVRLCTTEFVILVKFVVRCEILVRETCACLAHSLVLLIFSAIHGKKECTVGACTLSLTVERTNGNDVEAVGHAIEVVLLEFQPIQRPFRRLVSGVVYKCFQHETFAGTSHGLVQCSLHLFLVHFFEIPVGCEHDLSLFCNQCFPEALSTVFKRLLHKRLSIEQHNIKRVHADIDLDVLDHDVLPPSGRQGLEGEDSLCCLIESHKLAIDDATFHTFGQIFLDHLDHVWIFFRHVLGISAVNQDAITRNHVHLSSFTVILPLTSEALPREAFGHLAKSLRRLRKHRFDGDSKCDVANARETSTIVTHHESLQENVEIWQFAEGLFHGRLHRYQFGLNIARRNFLALDVSDVRHC
mmetsp:Transcript_43500/g.114772  ORF Transcript_43500/g.114772 Transcript_43500/m.114772 type:complete len:385 (-) Transcript_43500:981-2135(-)